MPLNLNCVATVNFVKYKFSKIARITINKCAKSYLTKQLFILIFYLSEIMFSLRYTSGVRKRKKTIVLSYRMGQEIKLPAALVNIFTKY